MSKVFFLNVTIRNFDVSCIAVIQLEIPTSRVFLGANAQLLGTSLAGDKMTYHYNTFRLNLMKKIMKK